ncbi:MAG: glycosyltransferase [Ignavibacteriales bacterium]
MKRYSVICICQIYNELRKSNLERFVKYAKPLFDELVVYDDGSIDGSYEYMLQHTPYVIHSYKNEFTEEKSHKQILLNKALEKSPDFIFWLDADEVLTANASERIQELCEYCVKFQIDGLSFHEINLWRSLSWRRTDSLYNEGWFTRLWRVTPEISFGELNSGLHQLPYPVTIKNIEKVSDVKVIHYGFSSHKQLAYKYLNYKSHGQRGYDMLDRLISEEKLVLEKVPKELFPEGLWIDDDKPNPLSFAESLSYVEKYRGEVLKPKISIICLIYKSVEWLRFVYEQVIKYTDMTDKEFFFVANDANDDVIEYLRSNYINYYVFNNKPEHKEEWYINNVYRAYNFGAQKAHGDFLVFINSDMAFTPYWLDNLFKNYNGSNCIASRLVESGRLRSGTYGIEMDFGITCNSYMESKFQMYADDIKDTTVKDGGLFMPLLVKKEHFESVGGYPEGNITPESDIYKPKIALKGEECISGDNVLMRKLQNRGISHQTAFDSIVYHFQCGESESKEKNKNLVNDIRVAICNDYVTGSMGEKVLWNFLCELLPATVGIDINTLGKKGNYSKNAKKFIRRNYPGVEIIIQNATFIDTIDESIYTIAFLQDDLRSMERSSLQQEKNLVKARKKVSNSVQTAISYPEYDFDIIPIGVDSELFRPMDKTEMRQQFNFGTNKIGIFVGDLSQVKGWAEVKRCIEYYKEITWIVVTKGKESYYAENAIVFNRIPQQLLAQLLNCADFFIIGSLVETQCLAAIEACLCDIPLIMHKVGIFRDFTEEERAQVGIFTEDFISAIRELENYSFSPRKLIIEKALTINNSISKWQNLLKSAFLEIMKEKSMNKESYKYKNGILNDFIFELRFIWKNKILKHLIGKNNLSIKDIKIFIKKTSPHFMYNSARFIWRLILKLKFKN